METQTVVLALYVLGASIGLAVIVMLVDRMITENRAAKAPRVKKAP